MVGAGCGSINDDVDMSDRNANIGSALVCMIIGLATAMAGVIVGISAVVPHETPPLIEVAATSMLIIGIIMLLLGILALGISAWRPLSGRVATIAGIVWIPLLIFGAWASGLVPMSF